jgi:hypothetical protein
LNGFLQLNNRDILTPAGKYKRKRITETDRAESDFDKTVKKLEQAKPARRQAGKIPRKKQGTVHFHTSIKRKTNIPVRSPHLIRLSDCQTKRRHLKE